MIQCIYFSDQASRLYNYYGKISKRLVHCTAYFPHTKDAYYAERLDIQQALGRKAHLLVIGLIFTPRTVCARVCLSNRQKELFNNEAEGHKLSEHFNELTLGKSY